MSETKLPPPIVSSERKRDPRLRWFDEARFGMFVHFGLYTQLGRGEWVQYEERIPRHQYERLTETFNPHRFSADTWVDLAEQAGAQYITVTAKHHDGFCLFDSALTDYKITNTRFGRDLIGELIAACQRRGMRLVIYYSQPDWYHPNFAHRRGAFKDLQNPPPDQRPDWPKFQDYVEGQVRELVTNYGRVDGIWLDGSHKSEAAWRGRRLYELIKEHQPHAVVNDRARCGDFYTPERSLPDDLGSYLFEACQSVQTIHWGWMKDSPLFNTPHLVESLGRMAAAGGNYLLNVGPLPDGTIPEEQAARMREIGAWLRRNGEAIYATEGYPLETGSPQVLATRRGSDIFLYLLRWPEHSRIVVPGILSAPESASLLGTDVVLGAERADEGLALSGLPASPPEASVSVVALRFAGEPRLRLKATAPEEKPIVEVPETGSVRFGAEDARLRGRGVKGHCLRVAETPAGAHIEGWTALQQRVEWTIRASGPRRRVVRAELACPGLYAGSRYVVECGQARTIGEVRGTESFQHWEWQELGTIELPAGKSVVRLRPLHMPYGYIFANVRAVELSPTSAVCR